VPFDSELLQVGLANVEPLAQAEAVLPRKLAFNPASGNLAVITNPNLEDYHIVYLQPFPRTAVDGCLRVHSHMPLFPIHHCPVRHLKVNRQLNQRLIR
jgi:hypothetical protein